MERARLGVKRVDSYLGSGAMRAMSNSLSLASTVLRFQIVELWYENDKGGYSCTYVHAVDEVTRHYKEIIVGYYPNHNKEHVVSPRLCKLSKESPTRCHWRCLEEAPNAKPLYDVFGFPVLTEMSYVVEGRSDGPNVFIVAFSSEIIEKKQSKLKFLFGLGYAISVAVFDFEDESDEERDAVGDELDIKKFTPARPLVATPMASVGSLHALNAGGASASELTATNLGLGIWGKNLSEVNLQALHVTLNTPRSQRAESMEDFGDVGMTLGDSPSTRSNHNHKSIQTPQQALPPLQHLPLSQAITHQESTESLPPASFRSAVEELLGDGENSSNTSRHSSAEIIPVANPAPFTSPPAISGLPASPTKVTVPILQIPPLTTSSGSKKQYPSMPELSNLAVASQPTDAPVMDVYTRSRQQSMDQGNNSSHNGNDTARSAHSNHSNFASVAPTWDPQAVFNFPVKEIPPKNLASDDLTMDSFTDIKHLADGSNANVFLGKLRGQRVIIKMIKAAVQTDPVSVHEFDVEHGLLCRMSHPNIIRILGAGIVPRRFIVLEYLGGGTLNTMLSQNLAKPGLASRLFRKPTFTYTNLLLKARDMADAFDYIHRRVHPGSCILHRDLKPDNVGFTSDGVLKLFDFGLATCVKSRTSETEAYEMTGFTGSLRYMAPESALRKPYTEKVDVYSYGILVWQMARDRVPFKGLNKEEFLRNVSSGGERPKLDSSWPPAFSNLLTRCWHQDPLQRPTFANVIEELDRMIHGESTPPPAAKPRALRGAVIKGASAETSNSTWF